MSESNKQTLGAMAMDLKRVALAYFRGSTTVAERFYAEALERKKELDTKELKPYLQKMLNSIEKIKNEEQDKAAEDALMYSTLFQNASCC